MLNVLVTGARRGIGLELTKQWLERGHSVISSCRNLEKVAELKKLKEKYKENLKIVKMDVTKVDSISQAFQEVSKEVKKLDILINNAGIIAGTKERSPSLGELYKEDLVKVFETNAIGPLLVTENFLPLLEQSSKAKIVNISSQMGSITLRGAGGYYSYSSSKAALNMISRLLSFDLKSKGIIVLNMHPGWVKTDMGGLGAPLEPKESVRGIIKVIESATIHDSGRFLDWQGRELPW